MKKYIIMFLFLPSIAFAIPIINGILGGIVHDNSLTIMGSGFGTKVPAAPFFYSTFNSANVNDNISTATGGVFTIRASDNLYIDNTMARTSRYPRNIHANITMSNQDPNNPQEGLSSEFWINNIGGINTNKMYINTWVYHDRGAVGEHGTWQTKLIRAQKSTTSPSGNIVEPSFYPLLRLFPDNFVQIYIAHASFPSPKYFSNNYFKFKQWMNYSIEQMSGTLGNSDGGYKAYLGNMSSTYDTIQRFDLLIRTDNTQYVDSVQMENYGKNEMITETNTHYVTGLGLWGNTKSINVYYDSIYVDNVWSRIELGDNPVYSSCTHREIQFPTAWSEYSITVKVKMGSFSLGDNLYLFVIDSDGNPSGGWNISWGNKKPSVADNVVIPQAPSKKVVP